MKRLRVLTLCALCASLAVAGAWAATDPPAGSTVTASNYQINWYSINGGGTVNAASANFRLAGSAAQSVAGATASANFQAGIGFWYGVCSCPCHGDPICDGVPNLQDVVATVNVAFRGYPSVFDPQCPRERTDVGGGPQGSCDGVTTVLDVVRMVNVAFRGYDPATEFCDPCQ